MEQVMSYREFIEEFKKRVLENPEWGIKDNEYIFFPEGFEGKNEVEKEFVLDTNRKYYLTELNFLLGDFVMLAKYKSEDLKSCNRYCLKKMYEEYIKTGWENVLQVVDSNVAVMRSQKVDDAMEQMKMYEKIKNQLMIRPLNYTDHKYELKNAVYRIVGDVALVLYVKLEDTKNNLLSCKMDKTFFSTWGIDEDEVFEMAMKNTEVMAPPRLYFNAQDTANAPYYRGEFLTKGSKITQIKKFQVPVLTTTRQLNGAISIFYPGVMERIAELIGGSYYVAFTSIHEVRIHAVGSVSPRSILQSLKDVNKMFDKNEILSRKVFCYDVKEGKLTPLEL